MKRVPIHDIDAAHGLWHLRRVLPPAAVRKLKADLEADGQLSPLIVRVSTGPAIRLQLIAGKLRLEAAKALGWTHVFVTAFDIGIAEAASLALRAEFRTGQRQTCLERAWAAVHTRSLRALSGEPTEIRPMARACGLTRSTLWNALSVGETVTPDLVDEIAQELNVSVEKILALPQSPLLTIAREGREEPSALLRTAVKAHVGGTSATKAVREALDPGEADEARPMSTIEPTVTRGGQVKLAVGEGSSELSPRQAAELGQQLLIVAGKVGGRRPNFGRVGQVLDGLSRKLWHGLRQIVPVVVAWGSRVLRIRRDHDYGPCGNDDGPDLGERTVVGPDGDIHD